MILRFFLKSFISTNYSFISLASQKQIGEQPPPLRQWRGLPEHTVTSFETGFKRHLKLQFDLTKLPCRTYPLSFASYCNLHDTLNPDKLPAYTVTSHPNEFACTVTVVWGTAQRHSWRDTKEASHHINIFVDVLPVSSEEEWGQQNC